MLCPSCTIAVSMGLWVCTALVKSVVGAQPGHIAQEVVHDDAAACHGHVQRQEARALARMPLRIEVEDAVQLLEREGVAQHEGDRPYLVE